MGLVCLWIPGAIERLLSRSDSHLANRAWISYAELFSAYPIACTFLAHVLGPLFFGGVVLMARSESSDIPCFIAYRRPAPSPQKLTVDEAP